jgi:Flp pilus assembly protein TadD
MVEHRVYLPALGPFLAVAAGAGLASAGLARRARRWAWAPGGALAAAVLALAAAAHLRNETWRDPVALWAGAATEAPDNQRAHASLGFALLVRHRPAEAAAAFRAAIALRPADARPYNGLSRALAELGRPAEAEAARRDGMRLAAADQLALGRALLSAGAAGQAVSALEKAAWFAPGDEEIRGALARARQAAGGAPGEPAAGAGGATPAR